MSNVLMLQHLGEDDLMSSVEGCLSWLSCYSQVSSKSNQTDEPLGG